MKKIKLIKPQLISRDAVLDYFECVDYIEQKYNIQFETDESDFWVWLCDHIGEEYIYNDCTIYFGNILNEYKDEECAYNYPQNIKSILELIDIEFGNFLQDYEFYIEW